MCFYVSFPVCPCGTYTVGLSADQKGPCVGVEAVEIPSYIVLLVLVCVRVCIWLLNAFSLGPFEAMTAHCVDYYKYSNYWYATNMHASSPQTSEKTNESSLGIIRNFVSVIPKYFVFISRKTLLFAANVTKVITNSRKAICLWNTNL